MKRKLTNYHFPEGVDSMFINGKHYTRESFLAAQKKARNTESRFRDEKGRFS